MQRSFAIALAALSLAACQAISPVDATPVAAAPDALSSSAKSGYKLSEALCSGCHSIALGQVSPNPQAPPFEMIANTSGLTLDTLGVWMHDSHNFPEKMNFEVADEDVDYLAAYIVTLRSENYTPPIQ